MKDVRVKAEEGCELIMAKDLFGANTSNTFVTDITSAEMIKYASNSMLAARISFMNEIALLCDKVGANVKEVAVGMGMDTRIGPKFLNAGIGFGGSCFPKDVSALYQMGKNCHLPMRMLDAVLTTNEDMKMLPAKMVKNEIAIQFKAGLHPYVKALILGASFKPNTDDVRYCATHTITKELLQIPYVDIVITDPVAIPNYKNSYTYEENHRVQTFETSSSEDLYRLAKGCNVVILATEWEMYKNIDFKRLSEAMSDDNVTKLFIDGRNVYKKEQAEKFDICYKGIGNN